MKSPADVLEIFLQPGEFYFGDAQTRIRTLLGSCVAITLWHPRRHIGGMCHYMLPERAKTEANIPLDGRYGDEAMQLFIHELKRSHSKPAEYQVKLFGGGQMFEEVRKKGKWAGSLDIAKRNIDFARGLIAEHGFNINAEDMGGAGYRNIILDLWSGDVWVRRVKKTLTPGSL